MERDNISISNNNKTIRNDHLQYDKDGKSTSDKQQINNNLINGNLSNQNMGTKSNVNSSQPSLNQKQTINNKIQPISAVKSVIVSENSDGSIQLDGVSGTDLDDPDNKHLLESFQSNDFTLNESVFEEKINDTHLNDIQSKVSDLYSSDEIKPLLEQQQSTESDRTKVKRKSIVKNSSSVQSFNRVGRKSFDLPDFDKPTLHVQFEKTNEKTQGRNTLNPRPVSGHVSSAESISSHPSQVSTQTSTSSTSSSDDSSSNDQFSEMRPPDGGWGWVVVFASFMVNLIADGITFSFGVIFAEFLNYFGESKAKTAWVGSLFMAMPLLSGPIASFMTDRFGCRKMTILGAILSSVGFLLSSFTDSMLMLYFTFGVLAGFGLSLCYVAAVVIVAYYFDKRRSFATGLSVCGSGIGTFIFAPLTQFLIEEYGWRGTTLILAGIFLHMIIFGLLMRDLEWTTYSAKKRAKALRERNKLGISAESFSVTNSTNTGATTSSNLNHEPFEYRGIQASPIKPLEDPRLFSSLITLPTYLKNGEKVPMEVLELLTSNKNVPNILLKNYPTLTYSRSFSEPLASHTGSLTNLDQLQENVNENKTRRKSKRRSNNEEAFRTWLAKGQEEFPRHRSQYRDSSAYFKDIRMHRHSLTYRGAMLNINRYRLRASSCPDIYRNSMTTIAKEKRPWVQEFRKLFVEILDFTYFKDIRFVLFVLSNFLLYVWYDVPYMYLVDMATQIGMSDQDASMLISIIGIVNMFGEILLGWLGDRKGISPMVVYAVFMTLCGVITAMVPFFSSYTGLAVLSGLFGLFIAANYALTSIILVELITLERFTNAYGLLLLIQGKANLIGPPLAGWISDETGNYDMSFYIAGIFIAISGGLLFILPAVNKFKRYQEKQLQKKQSNQVTVANKYPANQLTFSKYYNGDAINSGRHEIIFHQKPVSEIAVSV